MSSFFGIAGCSYICPIVNSDWNQCIPASMKRRDPRIWHLAYSAAHKVITNTKINPKSIITGTALGALDETKNFLDTVYDTGFGNPRYFIASVHNSMAGKIALEFKSDGPNITVCEGQNSLASSVCMLDSFSDTDFPVLLILVDEHIELLDKLHSSFSPNCKKFLKPGWNDGAVAMILTKDTSQSQTLIRAIPPSICNGSPESALKQLIQININNYCGDLSLENDSSSYLQPAIRCYEFLNDSSLTRTIIGSFAPASDSVALVELTKNNSF